MDNKKGDQIMVRDDEFKQLIQKEMDREADEIMEEVNRDPSMKDVKAPNEIYEKLSAQILLYEEQKSYKSLSQEDEELIRLGKLYKKRRRLNMYLILAAALVLALGVCMSSMGGTKQALRKITFWLEGKEYIIKNTENNPIQQADGLSEEEALKQVEDAFGFTPVSFGYLPDGTQFYQIALMTELQKALLIYEVSEEGFINFFISPNLTNSAMGTTIDDEYVKSYEIEVGGTSVTIAEFMERTTQTEEWYAFFTYKDVWYRLSFTGIKEAEVEKVVKNLKFF